MSIFGKTGEPPPSESLGRRLSLFADREDFTRLFLGNVNNPAPRPQILFLHGMGGNGKSLLLRYLQTRCCVRFAMDHQPSMRDQPVSEILAAADEKHVTHVANALIDFGARPVGQQRPLEALPGLFILKRQLDEYKIKTPRFDFAAVNYLQKSGLSYKQVLPELFPASELDLAMSIADFLSGIPIVSAGRAILKIFEERTNDALAKWHMSKAIEKDHVARILEAPADPVLADLLPYYFALDLNSALTKSGPRSRIILFCDTHEAFWGEEAFPTAGAISLAALARDKWLRLLLGNLNIEAGVQVVVAGRKPPRWSQAEEAAIPDQWIDLRHIGGLTPADARWYLQEVGVQDRSVQQLVIGYASGSPDEVHPYMLGLCADVIASQGTNRLDVGDGPADVTADLGARRRLLISRLMSSVSEDLQRQVVAVAACRSFDYQIFSFLAKRLDFVASRESFSRLVNFSFILEATKGGYPSADSAGSTFAVHQLLRRELGTMFPGESMRAHEALIEFYQERKDSASIAEAILHRSFVDHVAGIEQWRQVMDTYLTAGQYADCQGLIGVVQDMPLSAQQKRDKLYYRVARAYLGTGSVAEAEALCKQLQPESVEATLLQADIEFYVCHFELAERTARQGLSRMTGTDRDLLSLRLAEILLYRGNFGAARHVLSDVQHLTDSEGSTAGLSWLMLAGEVAFFSGKADEAEARFADCRDRLAGQPRAGSDITVQAWNLADRGLIHLAKGEWAETVKDVSAALRLREEASHARGIANSLYLIGSALCGAGDHEGGRIHLGRGGKLARDQGDEVTLAKIRQSEGMSRFATGDTDGAIELLTETLDGTRKWGVPYDRAHALLDMALLRRATSDYRSMLECLEEARSIMARHEFGLLEHLYPDIARPPADRILAGLTCFAAGDALGAPWEGKAPGQITFEIDDPLPQREDWPAGSTTDDTDQLLTAMQALVACQQAREDDRLPAEFLTRLSAILPTMRGLGPTTPQAVARFERTGEVTTGDGSTNGGVLRALAVGWAIPVSVVSRRRSLTDQLTRTTHGSPQALLCASVVATMGSWALDGVSSETLIEAALEELEDQIHVHPILKAEEQLIRGAADGSWKAPRGGIPMTAVETLGAVIAVIRNADDPADAMMTGLRLGGDTDSVAALAGGILGCRDAAAPLSIPWLSQVKLGDSRRLAALAGEVAICRFKHYE